MICSSPGWGCCPSPTRTPRVRPLGASGRPKFVGGRRARLGATPTGGLPPLGATAPAPVVLIKRRAVIAGAYLAGANTRRVPRALRSVFHGEIGTDTVSRVWRKVKGDWDVWSSRSLGAEPIVRLILGDSAASADPSRPLADAVRAMLAYAARRQRPHRTGRSTGCADHGRRGGVSPCGPSDKSACFSARPASRPYMKAQRSSVISSVSFFVLLGDAFATIAIVHWRNGRAV
jgi:hypothetical protein